MATKEERAAADQARETAASEARAKAAAKAYMASEEQDRRDYQDWLEGKIEKPSEGAARLEAQRWRQGSVGTLKRAFSLYTPTPRVCPQCSTEYIGSSRFCPPCTDAAIQEHERRAAERVAKVDGMTVHEVRHRWANLPPEICTVCWKPQHADGTHPFTPRSFTMANGLGVVGLSVAIDAVKAWIKADGSTWLVLTGGVGIGKSHLAEVAARTLAGKGERVRWQPVGELLDRMRASFGKDEENAYTHLAAVAATPWLVLDDLGKSKPTGWVLDTLYMLINSRTVRRSRTLITTNDTLSDLTAKLGDAIADRVFDTHSGLVAVVTLSGRSFRTGR